MPARVAKISPHMKDYLPLLTAIVLFILGVILWRAELSGKRSFEVTARHCTTSELPTIRYREFTIGLPRALIVRFTSKLIHMLSDIWESNRVGFQNGEVLQPIF